jgi:hypothetical protein
MSKFQLKFQEDKLIIYSNRYDYNSDIDISILADKGKRNRYLEYSDFLKICEWKTPRSKPLCSKNEMKMVNECTKISLTTEVERLRIEILTLLSGVSWPTASTILHFCHGDRYPILDFRALWSLGIAKVPNYDFTFWMDYVAFCRELSEKTSLDMRTIDKALWQYSKENQYPGQ